MIKEESGDFLREQFVRLLGRKGEAFVEFESRKFPRWPAIYLRQLSSARGPRNSWHTKMPRPTLAPYKTPYNSGFLNIFCFRRMRYCFLRL